MTILDPRGSADPPLISKIKTLESHPFNSIFLFFNANLGQFVVLPLGVAKFHIA